MLTETWIDELSLQNYGGGLSPIGDGLIGAEDKMVPRPPQPNGSLHIKIDEVGRSSLLNMLYEHNVLIHLFYFHKV